LDKDAGRGKDSMAFKETSNWINGYIDRSDTSRSQAKVPVLFDGRLPDVPGIIRIGQEYFVLTSTAPLTYKLCTCSYATEIE
jgi:hypothetical protein